MTFDTYILCESEDITYIQNVLEINSNIFKKLPFNTNIPTITDRSARLNPRSPSKAGAVDLPYLPPEIHSLPSRHRGSNPAENERHDAAGAAKYIRTLVRGLREATRAGEKSWYTKINIGGEGSDHVAKQSARLRLGTSVNHPADPTTNMQRKKLSSSPRRRVPARIHSRLFSSYATYKQKITRKPSRNTSSVLDTAVSSSKPICFELSRAWHDHETTRLNRADVYKTNKNYASSSSGYRKERSTTYVSTKYFTFADYRANDY